MAKQTPAERRARRDAYAKSLTDPRTGQPFKNYNALDTFQRNQKAQSKGFTSRGQQRYQAEGAKAKEAREMFPGSWNKFLGGQKPNEQLARDFLKAFGPYKRNTTDRYKDESEELRRAYLDHMEDYEYDWDWDLWREEYSAL